MIQIVLQDTLFLVQADDEVIGLAADNQRMIVDQVGWQSWLLDVAVAEQLKQGSVEASSTAVVELAHKLLSILLWAPLRWHSLGWLGFQDALGYVVLIARVHGVSSLALSAQLVSGVAQHWERYQRRRERIMSKMTSVSTNGLEQKVPCLYSKNVTCLYLDLIGLC